MIKKRVTRPSMNDVARMQPILPAASDQVDAAYELNKALDLLGTIPLLARLAAFKDDLLLLAPRFLRHLDTDNRPDPTFCTGYGPCLIWIGAASRGYAVMRVGKKMKQASHVAWALFHGYWPKYLCHACDNRRCVFVGHLIDADAAFNAYDRELKKRGAFIVNRNAADVFVEAKVHAGQGQEERRGHHS
jgi:HNH endonuclease